LTGDGARLLARLRKVGARFGIAQIVDATACDRLGIPVAAAMRPAGRVTRVTEGRGESPAGALIGAIMEAIETAVAEQPRTESVCCEGTGLATGQRYLVPFEAAALSFDTGSTGLAAGMDRSDATRRALLECIERDALGRWLSGASRTRMASRFEPGPRWCTVYRLRAVCVCAEIRPIFWRVDNDFGVPTVLCQLFDHSPERGEFWGYTCGSASASLWRDAAAQALMEAVQTRIALRLHESAYDEGRSRRFRLQRFALEWVRAISAKPGAPPAENARLSNLNIQVARRILRRHGVEPVVVPLTPASAFPAVVRVLISGFYAPRRSPPAKARAAGDPRHPLRAA
jgi:ribosomal protein S12 methylthiotransferase accessory factor YcaO